MKKFLALSLAAVMMAGFLTACGNDQAAQTSKAETEDTKTEEDTQDGADVQAEENADDAQAQDQASEADQAEADAQAEADTQAEVSEVLADGKLTVGTNAEFPPFEFVDDNGEPDGFDIALIKAIGEKLGVEVEVENMEFDALVASIGNKIDVAIAGMTVTDERKKNADFSDPYYDAVQYVILPEGSEIAIFDDLAGKTIGVQLGTTGDIIASDDVEGANVKQYNKGVDAVNDLINGRVDCVIIDKNPALVFAGKFEGQLTAVDGEQFGFGVENYAIAIPKGDSALAAQINGALKELKEDGTFDELVKTYIEE